MTRFLWMLAVSSASMTALTLALHAALPRLLSRYRAKTVCGLFALLCLGFAVPLRPALGPAARAGAAAVSAGNAARPFPLMELLFALWLLGAAATLLLAAGHHARFLWTVRRWSEPPRAERTRLAYAFACADMGVNDAPALRICPTVRVPMLLGARRPVILLPDEGLPLQETRLLLRHELAHFQRGDVWGKAIALAASAVHWFNPAARLAAHDMGVACEIACDEAAVRGATPERRLRYSELLIFAARRGTGDTAPLAAHFLSGKEGVRRRVAAVMGAGGARRGVWIPALVLALCLSAGLLLPGRGATSVALDTSQFTGSGPQAAFSADGETTRNDAREAAASSGPQTYVTQESTNDAAMEPGAGATQALQLPAEGN